MEATIYIVVACKQYGSTQIGTSSILKKKNTFYKGNTNPNGFHHYGPTKKGQIY